MQNFREDDAFSLSVIYHAEKTVKTDAMSMVNSLYAGSVLLSRFNKETTAKTT